MKTKFLLLLALYLTFALFATAQGVGIGTLTPNSKAILDIKATDKGILFPRLTSAQRDAITNPPNGLHIYNTDEACLNYFDSTLGLWNCYCDNDTCKAITIHISADIDSINFYDKYGKNYPNTKKFVLIINSGVTIKGGLRNVGIGYIGVPCIDFATMPGNASIKIVNNGNLYGIGGSGGAGATGDGFAHGICFNETMEAFTGGTGGNAISTKSGLKISIDNYGIIAGGAGGGGGGGRTAVGQFGGGGGGGASFGLPGIGGGYIGQNCGTFGCGVCFHMSIAQNGNPGLLTTGGAGGTGASSGGNGGAGGAIGQQGQNGTGTGAGLGGAVGKAIGGGSGNSITNKNSGVFYGAVD